MLTGESFQLVPQEIREASTAVTHVSEAVAGLSGSANLRAAAAAMAGATSCASLTALAGQYLEVVTDLSARVAQHAAALTESANHYVRNDELINGCFKSIYPDLSTCR